MAEEIGALKTIVKGVGIFFSGMVISKVITFFYRMIIARYFGPEDYGLFSLGLAVLGFAGIFAGLGMWNGVIRYVAYYKAQRDEAGIKGVLTSAFRLVILSSSLTSIFLFVLSPYIAIKFFHNSELTNLFRILSITLPFSTMTGIITSAFIGLQQVKYRVYITEILDNLTKLVSVIVFGILGLRLIGIGFSWLIASVLSFFFAFYLLENKVFSIIKTKTQAISLRKELLSYSVPLVLNGFMAFIITWTDTLMLGYFLSSEEVGIYNAAYPLAFFFTVMPGALAVMFVPIATEFYINKKFYELEAIHKSITKWIFYINFPFFFLAILFSKQILKLLFGNAYVPGYFALIFLSMGFFMASIVWTSAGMLEVTKRTGYFVLNSSAAAVVNVILNWYLIPRYGITGAAIASAFAYLITSTAFVFEAWYFAKLVPWSNGFIKSSAAGSISVFIVHYLARSLFTAFPPYILLLLFAFFITLYGFLLLLFRGIEKDDMEILKAIEKKTGFRIEFLRNIFKRFI